jgi:hypothetical protein
MAAPVNTVQSYGMVGIREQLSDVIYNKDPEETPLFSALKKTSATNTFVEWQTDTLRASRDNANIEGSDVTPQPRTATVRLGNYTQVFLDAVSVSGTDEALNKAGRGKQMAYELLKIGKEQRLDIERALFANQARNAGSSDTPRRMAGLPAWIYTNATAGSGGSNPTGDGTDARTDGTQAAFSQARFDAAMRSIVEESGNMRAKKVYLSPFQMDVALGFVGNNNQRNDSGVARVTNDLVAYKTPYGEVSFQMSLECRGRDVFILDESMWEIAQARPMKTKTMGVSGDNDKRFIVTELTVCAKNQKTSAIIPDCSTS